MLALVNFLLLPCATAFSGKTVVGNAVAQAFRYAQRLLKKPYFGYTLYTENRAPQAIQNF